MKEPIKKGDLCLVVGGLNKENSPNLNKEVTVTAFRGDFYQDEKVWECHGDGVVQVLPGTSTPIITGWAHFPQSWLQKIDPPETKTTETKEEELHA